MTSLPRLLTRIGAFSGLGFLSLACCLGCPDEPERNVCDNGAATATLSSFRFLEDDPMFVQSGYTVGGQGSQMLTARFVFEGDDVPDCASVEVSAVRVADGLNIWSETASVETEVRPAGGRQSRGTLFRIHETSTMEDCVVRLTATAYGQTTELVTTSPAFDCQPADGSDASMPDDAGADPGMPDGGAPDAGLVDGG